MRMRTIDQCISELKEIDPNCALTKNALRRMVITKQLPSVSVGNKYLVNLDTLQAYLENPLQRIDREPEEGKVRRINI